MRIDPSLLNNDRGEKNTSEPELPLIVLAALGFLCVLFIAGIGYLWMTSPLVGIRSIRPAALPVVQIAVVPYQGPLWELEKKRVQVKDRLQNLGLVLGEPFTIYSGSPMHLRPLEVKAQVGYLLAIGIAGRQPVAGLTIKAIDPGRRLVVTVDGHGDFTGIKAYRAAQRYLAPQGLKPGEGERYEVKRIEPDGRSCVEHWIPVR